MEKKNILIIVLLLAIAALVYYVFSLFYARDNSIISTINNPIKSVETKVETKGRSAINLASCNFGDYKEECKIVKYLEENLAWTNNKEGINFCSYDYLGKKDNNIYLKALCQEFYVSSGELICPDDKTLDKCFTSKNREVDCLDCTTKTVASRIVEGGGVSIPVRLTEQGDSYVLWTPRDGSLYDKDIKAEFPTEIAGLLSKSVKNVEAINVERAESYFGVKAVFNVKKAFENSCTSTLDCQAIPAEYAMLSNCPHTMKCVDSKCSVGCYDFIDHEELPSLEK